MSQELLITGVVLGAAFMHAAWNAFVKSGTDRVVTLAVLSAVWLLVGGALALALPLPARASWPFLALSTGWHYLYMLGLLAMYRKGDLGYVYPIARGSAPLLLSLLSVAVAGEVLPLTEWAGVVVISLGLLTLTYPGRLPRREEWPSLGAALATGVVISCYTLTDGMGVRRTDSALGYSAWLFFMQGLPWSVLLLWLRWRQPARVPLRLAGPGLLAGLMSYAAYALVIWALRQGPMAPIAALRETGVIFAALIGTYRLGEPFGRLRILASLLVATGVALINLP